MTVIRQQSAASAAAAAEGHVALDFGSSDWLRQVGRRVFSNTPQARHNFKRMLVALAALIVVQSISFTPNTASSSSSSSSSSVPPPPSSSQSSPPIRHSTNLTKTSTERYQKEDKEQKDANDGGIMASKSSMSNDQKSIPVKSQLRVAPSDSNDSVINPTKLLSPTTAPVAAPTTTAPTTKAPTTTAPTTAAPTKTPTKTPTAAPKAQTKPTTKSSSSKNPLLDFSSTFTIDTNSTTNPYKFQLYYDEAPQCGKLSTEDVKFTLVTQSSPERLWIMKYQCQRWSHDISLAVYIGAHDESTDGPAPTVESIRRDLIDNMNCSASKLTVQTVGGYSSKDFPIDLLRNTALNAVQTSHVIFVDIDFWVPLDLHEQLTKPYLATALADDYKLAIVLPAFELKKQCPKQKDVDCVDANLAVMPESKQQLLDLWQKPKPDNQIDTFIPYYTPAQGTTRYNDWKTQKEDELLPLECLESNRYEPFLVFRYCHDLPPFQNAFYGYGKDKDAWMMQTRRAGWHYKQISTAYIVHYPHLPSKARLHFNGGPNGKMLDKPKVTATTNTSAYKRFLIDRTYINFRNWLNVTAPDETVVRLCNAHKSDDADLWLETPQKSR